MKTNKCLFLYCLGKERELSKKNENDKDTERIINELKKIAFLNLDDVIDTKKDFSLKDIDYSNYAIKSLEYDKGKIKLTFYDKLKALNILSKILSKSDNAEDENKNILLNFKGMSPFDEKK